MNAEPLTFVVVTDSRAAETMESTIVRRGDESSSCSVAEEGVGCRMDAEVVVEYDIVGIDLDGGSELVFSR